MKTKLAVITLAALGGFAAFANSGSAHPDIRIDLGFRAPAPVAYCPPAPVVIVDRNDHNRYDNDRYDHDRRDRPTGFWKEIVVKTWVPATYVMRRDWFGRSVRTIEPAHFAYRTDRVWVSYRG